MNTTILRQPSHEGKTPSRPYSAVPHDLLRDRRLLPVDVLTAAALLVYARASAACWPSIRTLMQDVGKTRRTVQMSLARLRDAGWVASEPADNPTGRVLVLTWRGGAQPAPPGGRKAGTPRGAQPTTPEWKNQEEEKSAPPPREERKQPTRDELLERYTESGWLDRPPGDPLRRLAERSLSGALGAAYGPPPSSGPPPAPRAHGGQRNGLVGPRRLF